MEKQVSRKNTERALLVVRAVCAVVAVGALIVWFFAPVIIGLAVNSQFFDWIETMSLSGEQLTTLGAVMVNTPLVIAIVAGITAVVLGVRIRQRRKM